MLLSCGVLGALWAVLFGVGPGVALSYLLCGVGVAQEPTPLFPSGTVQVMGISLESVSPTFNSLTPNSRAH